MNQESLLSVRGLEVSLDRRPAPKPIVRDVSFDLRRQETLGIVGESGSGKSLTLRSLLGLLPRGIERTGGSIQFEQQELPPHGPVMRRVRGSGVGIVFQEPMTALNPLMRVGDQIAEARAQHFRESRRTALTKAVELLDLVGVRDPAVRARSYVHELSGGMRQRAMIAQALACEPKLLLCDEPTTALDVVVQRQVIDLLLSLRESMSLAMIFVSHDLSLVAGFCDKLAVMYAGELVECGATGEVLADPSHPYVRALLGALPSLDVKADRLESIPGLPPRPDEAMPGCRFAPRCRYAAEECLQAPVPLEARAASDSERTVRCLFPLGSAGVAAQGARDARAQGSAHRIFEAKEQA